MQNFLTPGSPYQFAYGMTPPVGRPPSAPFWGQSGGGRGLQPNQVQPGRFQPGPQQHRPGVAPGRVIVPPPATLLNEGPPPLPTADNQNRPATPRPLMQGPKQPYSQPRPPGRWDAMLRGNPIPGPQLQGPTGLY